MNMQVVTVTNYYIFINKIHVFENISDPFGITSTKKKKKKKRRLMDLSTPLMDAASFKIYGLLHRINGV